MNANRHLVILAISVVCIGTVLGGCSREDRDEAIDRLSRGAKELNGGVCMKKDDQGNPMPDVVRQQRVAELKRQNAEWTPENQKAHPIEYCQAQLKVLDEQEKALDVSAHKIAVWQNEAKRKLEGNEASIVALSKLLDGAKKAYREAEAKGAWPMKYNGFDLSKEKAQATIIDTAQRLQTVKNEVSSLTSKQAKLALKFKQVGEERRRLVSLREKVKETINDLNTKKVVDGKGAISDSLNAISDSITALMSDSGEVTIEDLMSTETPAAKAAEFEKIMAE